MSSRIFVALKKLYSHPAVGHAANWITVLGVLAGMVAVIAWPPSFPPGSLGTVLTGLFLIALLVIAARHILAIKEYYIPTQTPINTTTMPHNNHASERQLHYIDRDALFLLDFAVDQATFHLLETSIQSIPLNNDLSLEIDGNKRQEKMYEVDRAIRRVIADFANDDRRFDISNILANAEWKAREQVRNIDVPPHLDQLAFHECETLEIKAVDLKWYLMRQLEEKRVKLAQHRNRLTQQLAQKRRP